MTVLILGVSIAANTASAASPFIVNSNSFVNTGTTATVSLATSGAYTTNFFVIGGNSRDGSTTPTNTVANIIVDNSFEVRKTTTGTRYLNTSIIGHGPSVGTITYNTCSTSCNTAIAALAANVVYTANTVNGNSYFKSGATSASTTFTLTFPVATSNSFVIILYSLGGANFNVAPATNAIGCTLVKNSASSTRAAAAIMECNSLTAGTYSANIVTPSAAGLGSYAIGAYVFAPYQVTLDDSPATGTITPNGIAAQSNGGTISIIGTNTVTANPPAGDSFSSWAAGSANILVSNPLAATTLITVEGTGTLTADYTVPPAPPTLPTNIVSYIPIKINNAQTSAFPANAQIPIYFNAVPYQSYESNSLNNTEFFYTNGTIIPSWLEGNTLNEAGAANILYKSSNVLYWVRIYHSNTLLCASCSTTIYLGFAPKTTKLLSNTITGEAPQLSSPYAVYDTGANVFTAYDNFKGTSLSSAYWNTLVQSGATDAVNNGITFTSSSGSSVFILSTMTNYVAPLYTEAYESSFTSTPDPVIGEATTNTPNSCVELINGYTLDDAISGTSTGTETFQSQTSAGCQPTPISQISTGFHSGVWSLAWISAGSEVASDSVDTFTGTNSLTLANYKGAVGISNSGAGTNLVQWFRMRTVPPNNVAPTLTSGAVVNLLVATPNPYTLNNKTIDVGQISLANTVISNGVSGTTSYTGNWFWIPPTSSNIAGGNTNIFSLPAANNALTLNINAISSNTLELTFDGTTYNLIAAGANTIYGTWTFNAMASDANGDSSPTPQPTNTLVINPALVASTAPTPTSPILDSSQSATLGISAPTGGTAPYTYVWFSSPTSTCNSGSTNTGRSTASNTFSPSTTTYYCVQETDAVNSVVYTAADPVTVHPTPTLTSLTPSNVVLDSGQYVTYNVLLSGGTGPFTVNLINTATSNVVNTIIWSTLTPISNVITFGSNIPAIPSQTFNVIATDTGTANPFLFNSLSNTILVNSALVASAAPTPSFPVLDNGQSVTLTVSAPTTGTAPYAYEWFSSPTSTCNSGSTNTGKSLTSNTFSPTTNTYYCVQETDATSNVVYTTADLVTVHPTPTLTSFTPSNIVLDSGQYVTYNVVLSGGTGPFTVNLVNTATSNVVNTIVWNTLTPISNVITFGANIPTLGTDTFNVIATDTGTIIPFVFNSISNTIKVNSALIAGPITESNTVIDAGQSSLLTSAASGGTSPYTINWFASATCGGPSVHTGTTYTASPSSTTTYTYNVVDFATTSNVVCSASNTITVNAALTVSTPSLSANNLDFDQPETVTGTIPSTGTSPYTYNWLFSINNGVTYNSMTLCAINSGTGQSAGNTVICNIATSTLTIGDTYNFKLQVTDSSNTPATASSGASNSLNVASKLTAPAVPTLSSNAIDSTQQVTVSDRIPITGTSPYTYNWLISINSGVFAPATQCTANSGTGQSSSNTVTCSLATNTLSPGTYNFELQASDGATLPETAISSQSSTLFVNSQFVASAAPTPTSPTLDNSQSITLTTAAPTTGTGPYTYEWFSSATSTCNSGSTDTGLSTASNTFSPTSTTYYCVGETDSTNSIVFTSVDLATVHTTPALSAPLPSNGVLDLGQSLSYNVILSGGTGPFTVNLINSGTVVSSLSGQSAGTITFAANIPAAGLQTFNVIATDTGTTASFVFNSTSNTIIVNSALVASPAPIASNSPIDSGQPTTLTVLAPTTGTGPYTYMWFSGTSATCTDDSPTGFTGLSQIFTPISSTYYYVQETDSTNSVVYTGTTYVTVNPTLVAPSAPIASNSPIDSGQPATLTISAPTTGTSPYTYQWYSGTDPACTSDSPAGGQTGLTYALSPVSTLYYCVQATDAANEIVYTGTTTVTVNPTLVAPVISATPNTIESGQSSDLLTATSFSGGTPTYTCQWLQEAPGAGLYSDLGGSFSCTVSSLPSISTGTLSIIGTWVFELQVADSAFTMATSSPTSVAVTPTTTSTTTSTSTSTTTSTTTSTIPISTTTVSSTTSTTTTNSTTTSVNTTTVSSTTTTIPTNSTTTSVNTTTVSSTTINSTTTANTTTILPTNSTTTLTNLTAAPQAAATTIPACPFDVALSSPSQFYPAAVPITFYYTITPRSCVPIPPLGGLLNIYTYGSGLIYETVPVTVPSSLSGKTNGTAVLNTANLAPGRYTAQFYFTSSGYSNNSETTFYLIQPAKLLISNFTLQPNTTLLGSPLTLIQTVSNGGGLAASNATLNIGISGPNTFFDNIHQKLTGLGSNAIQTVVTQLAGDSGVAGVYTITENVSYYSNLTVNNQTYSTGRLLSNIQGGSYSIIYNKSSSYNLSGGLPVPPASVGNISLINVPVYASVLIGNTSSSYLGLADAANHTVSVALALPQINFGRLSASTKAFTLTQGNSEYIQLVFTPNANATPGTYAEPLYLNTKATGTASNGTSSVVYLVLNLVQKNNAVPNSDLQETLVDGKNLGVSMNIYNPSGKTLNNTLVSVSFPSIAAPTSGISLTGATANVTSSGGKTTLEWLISSIQPGHSVQLGYSISNPTILQLLLGSTTNLESTSRSTAPLFSLISESPLNLTVGQSSNVVINALYEGAYQPALTLSLSSNSTTVASPYKTVTGVAQEQIINASFALVPTAVRNTTLKLVVKGQNVNESYYLPIVISPKSTVLTRFVKLVEKDLGLIIGTIVALALLISALQVATEELPKSLRIEKSTARTSNRAMRRQNYDNLFELLSASADPKATRMKLKGVPTRWGIFTSIHRRDVRIVNDSGHLTIYTRGPVASRVKACLKDSKMPFVELPVR